LLDEKFRTPPQPSARDELADSKRLLARIRGKECLLEMASAAKLGSVRTKELWQLLKGNARVIFRRFAQPSLSSSRVDAAPIAKDREGAHTSLACAFMENGYSGTKLRTIVDAIPAFVWSAEPNGNLNFINQRWCHYSGVTTEAALGAEWRDLLHPEDYARQLRYWEDLVRGGQAGEFEARLRRFDGVFRWFRIQAVPQRDDAGRVLRWFGQNTDIEERKQAEMLLLGKQNLLEMMASGSSLYSLLTSLCKLVESTIGDCYCSISIVDELRSKSGHSPGRTVLLQFGAGPTVPRKLREVLSGRARLEGGNPCVSAALLKQQVILSDLSLEGRWKNWRELAKSLAVNANWSIPICSKTGDVLGTLAVLHKKSKSPTLQHQEQIAQFTGLAGMAIERANGEAALKHREALLVRSEQLSSSGSFSWRAVDGEIKWSEQLYRIFEFHPGRRITLDLIGSRCHIEDLPFLHEMTRRVRSREDFEYEIRIRMNDGSIKYLHMVAHGTKDAAGQLEYVGAVHDVTERRLSGAALAKVRAELAHVYRVASLSALTASIAHEVNQP
jgi:PAS domain S-box-containing protein